MLRNVSFTVLILVAMAAPAAAQALLRTGPRAPSREQVLKEQREEGEARRAMEDVPDKTPSKDPWGNVRSTPQASSTAKKKTH